MDKGGRRTLLRGLKKSFSALVVDDETDIRVLSCFRLKEAGFDPVWDVADGESAIDAAYRYKPHVVVLDYMMPGIDGEGVAKAIHLISPGTRILLFTAVLPYEPTWAHAFLDKADLELLGPRALALAKHAH